MPLGSFPLPPTGDHPPQVVPVPVQSQPPLNPNLVERQAGGEAWEHKTLNPAGPFTSPGVYDVDFSKIPGGFLAFDIYSPPGCPLYIGLDRPNTSNQIGGYDLYHPGTGFFGDAIPATTHLYVATFNLLAPPAPIEVYVKGGSYALR